ncbi:IS200/IS605 family transposase [Thiolapillus sp.]|uniref:IS200/IS605 family transposase n=4 Tax=Thiolapillus sp. TaxID=2017437 RepID=UPI0025DF6DBB|nr:IS200/IS605 family transposase [Thiolapillus sp.]
MPDKALRTGRHCVFMLHAHLIFITKYRGKVLSRAMLRDMEKIMRGVCAIQDVTLAEFNGETDHVHLLVEYPPTVQLSKLINSLKGVSSRRLRKRYPQIKTHWIGKKGHLWSPSYFAGSVGGAPIEVLKRYIEQQQTPH